MKCIIRLYKFAIKNEIRKIAIDYCIAVKTEFTIVKTKYLAILISDSYGFYICNSFFKSLKVDFYTDNGKLIQNNVELIKELK